MTLFNTFFIIIGVAEFIRIFQSKIKKDIIVYTICMILVFAFGLFFFLNPFKPSLLSFIL